ncbi:glycosyltransferase involved in cell wall biosynthesis [Pedobacter sp. AK017]|uniref:glycosyltransferase family 4 protein n=1 Tax=Pedobacter sp. AK017 TaxID=2723073 RepID=UPI001622C58E|nr:glycosyltransferase family 4 protein [Pedobacter sp. AK017]MBB5440350.1 glycosyltransferase involved in cell wall biosynthesis [Pedobacter sp. AK017]
MNSENTGKYLGNVAIISSCYEDWGGSEELWGRSVPFLLAKGYRVTVYKSKINRAHKEFIKLANQGVLFEEFDKHKPFFSRNITKLFNKVVTKIWSEDNPFSFVNNPWVNYLTKLLKKNNHVFAIVSQGINFDGLGFSYACYSLNIPYSLVCQKAVDFYWPAKSDRNLMTKLLKHAKACYFVSKHNKILTEEQFGTRLTNGHVIFNPLKIGKIQPYPHTKNGFRLACIGRLFILDKGQDILIRILSKKKWKDRAITITFVGSGIDDIGLKEMAALLDVQNISFAGQVQDIDLLWQDYHALILPSRSEGLPLSMVEAMAAGRIVIVSNAGGNTELMEENITGFSGYPYENAFEEAMERAWSKRQDWEVMGKEAARQIAAVVPAMPEKDFVDHVIENITSKY